MRVFTAIPFPEHLKRTASEIFRGRLPIPYVNTTNLRVTLNFFGELTEEESELVKRIFSKVVGEQTRFLIQLDKVVRYYQQIHLTLKTNPVLMEFQKNLESAFLKNGFRFQDRTYYPHVKLANLHMDKVMHPERKIENFPNQELKGLDFFAEKAVLFESKLLLHHAHHTPLVEQSLIDQK